MTRFETVLKEFAHVLLDAHKIIKSMGKTIILKEPQNGSCHGDIIIADNSTHSLLPSNPYSLIACRACRR
jgi:hypothetical protein